MKNSEVYSVDAPILAGEYLQGTSDFCVAYPKFNNNWKDIESWVVASGIDNNQNPLPVPQVLSDKNEVWCSQFTSIRNPDTGKEQLYALGAKDVYVIEGDSGNTPKITKTQRQDTNPLLQYNSACFFSSCVADNVSAGADKTILRYLYTSFSKDKPNQIWIYDAQDPSFIICLPFLGNNDDTNPIQKILRIPSNARTYWVFLVSSDKEPQGIYTIKETDALSKNKGSISLNEFHCYPVSGVMDELLADFFYFDETNLGSYQLALMTRAQPQAEVLTISLLAFDSTSTLKKISSFDYDYSARSVPSSDIVIAPIYKILKNPNGSISISIVVRAMSSISWFIEQQYLFPIIGSRVGVTLLHFDEVEKKFTVKSEAPQMVIYGDNTLPTTPLNYAACFYFSQHMIFSVPDYSKEKMSQLKEIRVLCHAIPTSYDPDTDTWSNNIGWTRFLELSNYIVSIDAHEEYVIEIDPGTDTGPKGDYVTNLRNAATRPTSFLDTGLRFDTPNKLSTLNFLQKGYKMMSSPDLSGSNVVVGYPRLTQKHSYQLFGMFSAMPFDTKVSSIKPIVTIGNTKDVITGLHKSTSTTWHAGITSHIGFSGSMGSLSAHFTKSWGGSHMHMQTDQTNTSVHVSVGMTDADVLKCYGSVFYFWEYPVYVKSKSDDPIGVLSVLIPDGFEDAMFEGNDPRFTYDQDYEIGAILTYLEARKTGYKVENLWFEKVTITCSADGSGGGSVISYNKSNTTQTEDTDTTEDGMNAGASLSLGKGFFNMGVSGFYSKHSVKNNATSTSKTKDFSITFTSGSVKDSQYQYTVTPVVYNQPNNLLMLAYDIDLIGAGWKTLYFVPDIILFRVYPFSTNEQLNKFTRSIHFYDNGDGTTDIEIVLFGNSFSDTLDLTCRIYEGMAEYPPDRDPDVSKCKLIDTLTVDKVEALSRISTRSKNIKLKENTIITLCVEYGPKELMVQKYYWGIYPYDAFANFRKLNIKESL